MALSTAPAASAAASDELIESCAQFVEDATTFLRTERLAPDVPGNEVLEDVRLSAALDRLHRELAGTRDPDLFLADVLLGPGIAWGAITPSDQKQLRDLGERAAEGGSALLAWHALRTCADGGAACPFTHLEERLLAADNQNAEAWVLVATLRYRRGDRAGALAAMRGAASAPTATWYWTETIALLDRSLAARTSLPYRDRVLAAFGAAAARTIPVPAHAQRMCQTESALHRGWAEACLAFGELRLARNEAQLAKSLADPIREHALHAESIQLEELKMALVETGPARLQAYLSHVQQLGELEGARQMLRQELPLVLERAGMMARADAKSCVARILALDDAAL